MDQTTRILLVDDDPGILDVFSCILRLEGYEVWEASTGQQALQIARERNPDLILLDVILPDLNGMEVCKQIKTDPALLDVFVVLVSGQATSSGHMVLGLESGADEYIPKPMDMPEFLARIRTFIRLRDTTAALRASEQHYRRLVEILPDAVSQIDLKGRIIEVNPQAATMLGYGDEGELTQQSIFDLTQPEDHERLRADMATMLETGMMRNAEYTFLRKNGNRFPVELSAVAVLDGQGKATGLVAIGRDISERKRAEESLRLHEEMLQRVIGTAMDGFWMANLEGKLLDVNEAYCQMSGYPREELLSMRISDLDANETSPADVARHMQQLVQAGRVRFETRHRRKDGWVIGVEVSATCLELGERFSFAFLRDITKRKQADEELRRFPWRIIEAQEAERLRVARELHDGVNQIIAAAKMRLHKLVTDGTMSLNPAAREILKRCDRQLVQALEENRRIAHNLRPSDLDEFGLDEACRNFCKELQSRTELVVKCTLPRLGQRLPPAAELSLFRIVQEAINNAEKHAHAKTIRLQIAFQDDSLLLRIQDDGRGFDPAMARAGKQRGHGIGFTNIRERAESLGGTCEIESVLAQGTTITVRMPWKKTK